MQIFGNIWSLLQVKQPQYRLKYCKKLQCDILYFFQNLTITDQKAYGMLSSCYFFCFKVKCKQEEKNSFLHFGHIILISHLQKWGRHKRHTVTFMVFFSPIQYSFIMWCLNTPLLSNFLFNTCTKTWFSYFLESIFIKLFP